MRPGIVFPGLGVDVKIGNGLGAFAAVKIFYNLAPKCLRPVGSFFVVLIFHFHMRL